MAKPIIMQHPDARDPVTAHPSQVANMQHNGWAIVDDVAVPPPEPPEPTIENEDN